jgi:predicted  nucleic acid-binding Zn-ribbon protein
LEEIEEITVEVANSHADPEAMAKAMPRLEHALKRLQTERAETHRDLDEIRTGMAAARDALRARGVGQ